ncbi:hypothetical protein C8J56DRAFT_928097 [Mycena floridula]|nr:hypothetical protein C8J56DRAFT_928097 [Mycena floridula]
MELKLVYRFLRKVSEWTINGYYSEVEVLGYENVPKDGPIILAATHHNEIIDIAVLAAKIPHRRHVSFWAKSTMFANPLASSVLSSSGAIPVHRNPNNGGSSGDAQQAANTSALFKSTSLALSQDEIIGVFPEGTSYTQPKIVQCMSGCAWAAVEFIKWQYQHKKEFKEVLIIPVGIVYTDKAKFQSRVCVQFGKPISVNAFCDQLFTEPDDFHNRSHAVVKKIMSVVEEQLSSITINAPDWETLFAAQMTRDLMWPQTPISLKDWVPVNQRLINILTAGPGASPSSQSAKSLLTKYFSLLHHTGLVSPLPGALPSILSLPKAVFQTALFIPPFLLHLPGYIIGNLTMKCLATPGEEEGEAQYRAIGGGIGLGLYWAMFGRIARRWVAKGLLSLSSILTQHVQSSLPWNLEDFPALSALFTVSSKIWNWTGWTQSWWGNTMSVMGLGWLLVKWHGLLVKSNHARYLTLWARYHILLGKWTQGLQPKSLDVYMRLPPPPTNAFIRRRNKDQEKPTNDDIASPPKPVPPRKLIKQLHIQRQAVTIELAKLLSERKEDDDWLKTKGGQLVIAK